MNALRLTLSMVLSLPVVVQVAAQERSDSIAARELNEVVVQTRMQSTSPTSLTYTPSVKQKNSAQNLVDLLRQMAIPVIKIHPVDETVTDNAGAGVAVYVNFIEATREDIVGLRTSDVRRVEYLEFPTDPRFRGAEKVINVIVHEYAYGGYTKVTANENFLIGLSSRVNIFSKFTYGKMTYDLYAGASNLDSHHLGNTTSGTYRLSGSDGGIYELTRMEILESSHYRQNQYPVTFRATYNSDKVQIRNLIAFTNLGVPVDEYSGVLQYSRNVVNGYGFERKNPNRSNSLAYSGSYFFALSNGFSVDFSPSFEYTHGNDYTDYSTTGHTGIHRHAKEDAYNYRLNLFARKRLGLKHSVMVGVNGGDIINKLRYTGDNTDNDRFHNVFAAGMAGYNFQTAKLSVNFDAGLAWENSDINGQKNSDTYPFTHLNVRYAPNHKNSVSAYIQYATNSPDISQKTSDILKENEFMYITGNPLLENCRHTTVDLAYTWMPSNAFGMSAYGHYFGMYDRQLLVYMPYGDGSALLRSYVNDGNYQQCEIGVAVNWKLLGGKLQLYANPSQSFYRSTGIFNRSCNPFRVTAQVNYYLDSFYFQACYESPQKSMFSISPEINRVRNFHSVTVGWANANWNLRAMAANFLNKGWIGATRTTDSPYYTACRTIIGTSAHPRINLTVTYTFGYGKKIQRGNEVGEQSGANSAILK